MLRLPASCLLLATLAACNGTAPAGNPSFNRTVLSGTGTCPAPDPARDGLLVDAIRRDDATPVETILAADPSDTRARAALVLISGQGRPDPDEAACFAPYLATG